MRSAEAPSYHPRRLHCLWNITDDPSWPPLAWSCSRQEMQLRVDVSGGCPLRIALCTHRSATMDKLSSMHEAGWHSHQALQNLWQNEHTEKILMNVVRTCIKWTGLHDLISNHTHKHIQLAIVSIIICVRQNMQHHATGCYAIVCTFCTCQQSAKCSTVHYSLNHTDIQ